MSYEELALLIDGRWTQGTSGKTETVVNPSTNEALGELPLASIADLDEALEASQKGFDVWRKTPAIQRQTIMEKTARLLEERLDVIAANLTREMGKPLKEARMELGAAIDVLRWYGEEGKRVYGRVVPSRITGMRQTVKKEPIGPVIAFVAWNFPAINVMRKVAGAIGAGCSITIKASEETPGTCIAIGRAFMDAGLPAGVLNIVFGDPATISSHLCASDIPRKLSFTGSVPIGKHLQKLAADKMMRCTMELGGHAPVLVFSDADIDAAVRNCVAGKYRNAGQVCVSPTRFLVQEAAYDKFATAFRDQASKLVVGDGLAEKTDMGPLIAERRIEVMENFMADALSNGSSLLTGGERLSNSGSFFAPTVLGDVTDEALIMNEEPFGPIAPISRFSTLDEAIERANRLPFGLAAYAFTKNAKTAAALNSEIQSVMLAINSLMVASAETPFGGIKDSGYGSEGSIEGMETFLTTRFVTEIF